jgi:hypothetical protein
MWIIHNEIALAELDRLVPPLSSIVGLLNPTQTTCFITCYNMLQHVCTCRAGPAGAAAARHLWRAKPNGNHMLYHMS